MNVLGLGVHRVGCSHLAGQQQFLVVNVGGHHRGPSQGGAHNGTHAHHAAAYDQHHVDVGHLGTAHGVEAYAHRLHQGANLGREQSGGNDFLPGQDDEFAHGAIALNAQRLIMLAGVHALVAARGALATVGVGIHRNRHAGLQPLGHMTAHGLDGGSHLVAGNDGVQGHAVAAHERVQVAAAESHVAQAQQHLLWAGLAGAFHVDDVQLLAVTDLYCFHFHCGVWFLF